MKLTLQQCAKNGATLCWGPVAGAASYRLLWSDRRSATVCFKPLAPTGAAQTSAFFAKSTHRPYWLKAQALGADGAVLAESEILQTPVTYLQKPQLEALGRGLVAVRTNTGVFLSWRLFINEVNGYNATGLTGVDFVVYRDGERLAAVTDSTSYIDEGANGLGAYAVAPLCAGKEYPACAPVRPWQKNYYDLPLQIPAPGMTPAGDAYTYRANDMSVGDVDGDGEYEFFVKWDPSNAQDVSIKGYTGHCILDCYRLSGQLLWRLDLGVNIRAGAHYTQFMVYDFNGDGRAELALKTAPGTKMTRFAPDGTVQSSRYITMPQADIDAGYAHSDNYVCSAADYRAHMAGVFAGWQAQPDVMSGRWPKTVEECFGLAPRCAYPLCEADALALADYFIDEYAPSRSARNELRAFEGFIYDGPEYLTMFDGLGAELQTIPFPVPRGDDGLRWGDYAWPRIEPCNRVDRFLSAVAYLDGERPYLIVARGYYTRATVTAYDFFENAFHEVWRADSGHVPMDNPFKWTMNHARDGSDPVYGKLAGQGNHSLSCADLDGDGCMEIVFGAAVLDQDGSLLYSSFDKLPDGTLTRLGHGDSMHVADIDPDRPGLEIFNVFEEGVNAPYGYALRDAESGKVYFGEYFEGDLGRCMIGDMVDGERGLQVWVNDVFTCKGKKLNLPAPGTNARIYWAPDLTTQVTDGPDYLHGSQPGRICDLRRGVWLEPEGTATNNGTKGNPCLIADIFGDYREELLLRLADSSAIRIYTATDACHHKLFTLMHDTQYRCGVAWQNNCYNQPVYPSFYYASDMDFANVLPALQARPTLYLAGDSTLQSYADTEPLAGWGQALAACAAGGFVAGELPPGALFPEERRYTLPGALLDNAARGGRSSRSYLAEGYLDALQKRLQPGDVLLVQFGRNDCEDKNGPHPERAATPAQFAANLAQFVQAAKAHGAHCLLVTPLPAHTFDAAGRCRPACPAHTDTMLDYARRSGTPCLDLGGALVQACNAVGALKSAAWFQPDGVHLTAAGAARVAQAFAALLRAEKPELPGWLTALFCATV